MPVRSLQKRDARIVQATPELPLEIVPPQDRSNDVLVQVDCRVERKETDVGSESYDDLQDGEVRSASDHQIEGGEARKPTVVFRRTFGVNGFPVSRVNLKMHKNRVRDILQKN